MRCKPNDIVQVLRSKAGNEGRVGTVERWVLAFEDITPEYAVPFSGWLVVGHFRARSVQTGEIRDYPFGCFRDEDLRPLPGGEGVDEILRIAGHPLSQSHREKVGV